MSIILCSKKTSLFHFCSALLLCSRSPVILLFLQTIFSYFLSNLSQFKDSQSQYPLETSPFLLMKTFSIAFFPLVASMYSIPSNAWLCGMQAGFVLWWVLFWGKKVFAQYFLMINNNESLLTVYWRTCYSCLLSSTQDWNSRFPRGEE